MIILKLTIRLFLMIIYCFSVQSKYWKTNPSKRGAEALHQTLSKIKKLLFFNCESCKAALANNKNMDISFKDNPSL